jgi:hypothetical protein
MPIDPTWLATLQADVTLADRDVFAIDGVEIELPVANARGRFRGRDWQRRVLSDLVPDSVQADAPERTPFKLLYALTTGMTAQRTMAQVFDGPLAPLDDLFRAETQAAARRKMTLAFHVLAVKAAEPHEREAKGFTERTLMLLCRDEEGRLDAELLRDLVEQFRRDPETLDLAQKTVLGEVLPGWTPKDEPTFSLPDAARLPEVPFDPSAAKLFREDLRNLLGAGLTAADFFQQLNLLLMVHLGLYQPRVAALLNPQMEALLAEMADPDARNLRDLEALAEEVARRHPFVASLDCRAPDPEQRPVTRQTPARMSFESLAKSLSNFHFSVLLLGQLRRLGEAWLSHAWGCSAQWRSVTLPPDLEREMAAQLQSPLQILRRMESDPGFASFLQRATAVLAMRFVHNQVSETSREDALAIIRRSESGLHALKELYMLYNIQNSRNATSSRAYRQGIQITSSLLNQGEFGLVQGRQRVGPFFQVGVALLPLLLLLVVGVRREKAPVEEFWQRLEAYGLRFDSDERGRLLARLRSMGVYERYSDAGNAAYVRNLMTSSVA